MKKIHFICVCMALSFYMPLNTYADVDTGKRVFFKKLLDPEGFARESRQEKFNFEIDSFLSENADFLYAEIHAQYGLVGLFNQENDKAIDKIALINDEITAITTKASKKDLVRIYSSLESLYTELNIIQNNINAYLLKSANEIDLIIEKYGSENSIGYCLDNGISPDKCMVKDKYVSSVIPSDSRLSMNIILNFIYNKNPDLESARKKSLQLQSETKRTLSLISSHIIKSETNLLINEAKKSGCNTVNQFDLDGNRSLMRNEPSKFVVYDMRGFFVKQSIKDGVILGYHQSDYELSNFAIFLNSNNEYVDNHRLLTGKSYACLTGIRSYITVLGHTKKIYAFKEVEVKEELRFISGEYNEYN